MSTNQAQYVTLVSGGGVPIRLADMRGAPYPTTGQGALVFNVEPTLIGPVTIQGGITWTEEPSGPYHSPLTARGDLWYYGPSGDTRLPLGPVGTVLTSNGTDAGWQSSSSGSGSITSITAGVGLTATPANPIISSGTLNLANTAVTPGTYGSSTQSAVIAIDQQGRITAASNATIAGGGGGTGTVSTVSVTSVNGFAGTVLNPTTTPAITLTTTITGLLKGNGTAMSAAVAGIDYMTPANVSATYLPLAGGTLTGALTGTTAAFSGEITAASPPAQDNDNSVATTTWVQGELAELPVGGATLTGYWNSNTALLVPPPASGRVRTSVAWPPAVASSIHFYISSIDVDSFVYTWGVGPSVGNPLVFRSASGARGQFQITAMTVVAGSPGYLDLTVTTQTVAGSLSNNSRCQISVMGGSAMPSGAAGGDLTGSYPNPTIKVDVALSGNPTTTTQATATNNTTLATTAYVKAQGYLTTATAGTTYQPLDTGLTVLSSIGTGIVVNTAADAFSPRTITGTASRVTITNGDGVAGNPTINISATYDALFQPVDATLTSLAAYNTNGLLTQTAADTFTGRTITGTASRLAVTNGSGVSGNPTLDIDSAYVGQSTITTLGTVATGTWQGSIIAGQYGGTGVNNTGKTITLGGNLTTSGAFASTFTMTGTTGVTFPTTGTLATLTDLTAYAPLASPTFTGDPKAPTPTAGDNDTSVATTAFVTTAITAVNGSLGQVQAGAGSCTLALNTDIVIGAYTVVSGNSGSWLNATTGVYTPPAGKYFIQSVNSVGHPPAGNGTWSLAARKNGTVITGTRQSMSGSATFVTTITVGCYVDANGTDTFDFVAQANASSMTEQGGDFTAFSIAGTTGVYLPLAGGTLTGGLTGTTATFSGAVSTNGFTAGYLEIPQNAQTGNYTGVLGDSGKHLYHAVAAAAATYTIPANGSVAYPIGATLTFVNDSANAVTIAITTDTLVLSPGTTTGSRTLATGGVATAVKVTSTRWIINGSGLT